MKKYIDCDGVILDTETGILDRYYEQKLTNPNLDKTRYLQLLNWEEWLSQAKILNDAIEIMKNYNPSNVFILTKVHSMQEAVAKIKYFRLQKIKNNIVVVPNGMTKSMVVDAQRNLLVDDNLNNLNDWNNAKGIACFYGTSSNEYPKITNLEEVLNQEKLEKVLQYHK